MIAMRLMTQIDTIRALGGAKAVGDALRARGVAVADVTVRSWTLEGRSIPAKYWVHIAAVAADRGVAISYQKLAEQAAA